MPKTQMTKEELREFFEVIKTIDHTNDHRLAARTLTSPLRRDIMSFIGSEIRSTEQIAENLNIEVNQVLYHLDMLKQVYYVWESLEGWKLTPRGIGFLDNARLG
ncbi:MAG: winged helix-turn-helix domain-containing protein [Promethearchaeota archaeon]